MDESRKARIYTDAIEHFGARNQIIKAIEEMAELTHALARDLVGDQSNIAEEIADVGIMLEQLKVIYDNSAAVDRGINFKLKRLERRIAGAPAYDS